MLPKKYYGETFIYEDSIILIERVDPFFYSDIKVKKVNDIQDHQLFLYFLTCESIIVENQIISANATFSVNVNAVLLPQDAVFLIEDSRFEMNYTILHSTISSEKNSVFVISDDMHTLAAFKRNSEVGGIKSFNASVMSEEVNTISYDFLDTGYYYIGFSPSGNTTLHIDYNITGYKYVRPSTEPSCVLHKSSDTCSIKVPESLTYSYGKQYCLFGEVVSNPYIADLVSVNVEYEVEHNGKCNFITILLFASFLSLCVFILLVITYWCACYRLHSRKRTKYVSIQ